MKAVFALVLALLVSAAAIPANAFTPGGSFTLSGPIRIRVLNSPPVVCPLSLTVNSAPFDTAVVNALLGGQCSGMHPIGLPWTVTQPSQGLVTITKVSFSSTYTCIAPVTGFWSNASPGVLTWSNATLQICTIEAATLTASPAQTLP
jgi:hypothetical protein